MATVIIDPGVATSPNGSFENATNTFPANGWTVVNDATNKWFVGTFVYSAGAKGAYIGTANTNNNYNKTTTQVSHFYRDVTFPSGENCITLTFKWQATGESCCDHLKVYLTTTGTTPTANTELAVADLISSTLNQQGTWQTATIVIPASNAGTTKRLVFSWRNDGSLGTNPAAAVDEISLTSSAITMTYATLPYSESFESWTNSSACGSGSSDIPTANWLNSPNTGNNSWRRNDQGSTAVWS
ncbi:MAG: hypothetical protein LC115_07690, partial [Bacteroidia bacterium]|nr:hypothetical protein [Bacteroidia bacterium]